MVHADSPSDLDVLRRIVLRDEAAIAVLYDRHNQEVYGIALRVLRVASEAEDVLQETFMRVWERADTYDPRLGSPAAWLARIARNRAIDRFRARKSRQPVDGQVPEGTVVDSRVVTTPETLLAQESTAGVVRGALAHLPPPQRTLIEAAFFEGCTHQELSQRFGVPLGTVKARIRTGLLALRGRLVQVV